MKDREILSRLDKLKDFHYNPKKNIFGHVINQLKLLIFLLANIKKTRTIYIWFCDYHSILPTIIGALFKKKSFIVCGGYDAVNIPELKFGVFYPRIFSFRRLICKVAYKLASHIICVDSSLIESVNYYIDKKGLPVGIKHYIPDLKTPIEVIPTGYDPKKWFKKTDIERENLVLTIGSAPNLKVFKRKGFDLFIAAAALLPHYNFMIIGLSQKMINFAQSLTKSSNITYLNFIHNSELINYYSKCKVFCQLSLHEGLPNTLCEAMLCEAIPVGSAVNGIPEAIGDNGFIVKERDPQISASAIEKAMNADKVKGIKARKWIIQKYPQSKRESSLKNLF